MERIQIELPPLPPEVDEAVRRVMGMSPEQQLAERCRMLNNEPLSDGRRSGAPEFYGCYDCPDCRNKTLVYYPLDGDVAVKDCACVSIRGSLMRARGSGLADELGRCRFSNFTAAEPWQRDAKQRVMQYASAPRGWLYLCGQAGSGKTHLCTAAVGSMIRRGMRAKYMRWRDDAAQLKACVNEPEYRGLLAPFVEAEVLYIDDFLKTERGEGRAAARPSTGDLNLAFQIIGSRYCSRKTTILSSEHSVDELIGYDEAVGSRIYELARENCIVIPYSAHNNYRLKG